MAIPVIKRILFATDLSETARHSFGYAVAMADRWDCELLIVHVIKGETAVGEAIVKMGLGDDLYQEMEKKKAQSARNVLIGKRTEAHRITEAVHEMFSEAEKKLKPSKKLKVRESVTEAESISEEILNVAAAEKCDVIVLGHRKKHLLPEGLGEGTLKKVLKAGTFPVFVVPPPK
ncbi:MAG: universal stress protein [Desulfobacteraceae bacterium]|nr:universal stress protein [Desulfobacteraceae bacterium]